jgi:hypothetical protein
MSRPGSISLAGKVYNIEPFTHSIGLWKVVYEKFGSGEQQPHFVAARTAKAVLEIFAQDINTVAKTSAGVVSVTQMGHVYYVADIAEFLVEE